MHTCCKACLWHPESRECWHWTSTSQQWASALEDDNEPLAVSSTYRGWTTKSQHRASLICTSKIAGTEVSRPIAEPGAFLGGWGQKSPSPEDTSSGLHGPAGCSDSCFGTAAPGGAGELRIGLPKSPKTGSSVKIQLTLLPLALKSLHSNLQADYVNEWQWDFC